MDLRQVSSRLPITWTELRVLVPRGWEELVAETLRVGPVTTAVFGAASLASEPVPAGFELVRCYLADHEDTPALRAELARAVADLSERSGIEELRGLALELRPVPPEDWENSWKKTWHAFRLGRMCLVPSWSTYVPRAGELRLVIEPGPAFGSGRHPTTRACLSALQQRLRPGARVLDAGTGSGVLSIAAALLGAERVLGFDVDANSPICARALAADNAVTHACEFRHGGFEVLRAEDTGFDAVLANIYSDVIQAHARELAARLRPGGWFAFSGCPAHHVEETRRAIEDAGLTLEATRARGRWHTFVGLRPPA